MLCIWYGTGGKRIDFDVGVCIMAVSGTEDILSSTNLMPDSGKCLCHLSQVGVK